MAKEYDQRVADQVSAFASLGFSQRDISKKVPTLTRKDLAEASEGTPEGTYRDAWEKGKFFARCEVRKAFFELAKSGKSLSATLHWLAINDPDYKKEAPYNPYESLTDEQVRIVMRWKIEGERRALDKRTAPVERNE